ncbi:hypothetical protein TNIN_423114 [Trichonephila inaurata madagascariensis]|uniref:Uncharacterized protein n=1 Tax=Trichonephila inaurata madagascariensis TaxID=2747483 RepID=A0A8X6MBJ1_9ARAC|nr:hypothetical protein TNIN_423114 [Trichonephila inaurata madagascariensis]
MGCVSSVFQYGSYLVDESKNEAAPEVKEETENGTGDIPSTQELPSKTVDNETPIKVENVKLEEAADEVNDKTVEPTVTEFERLRETKIEKEKTIKDSGETTEPLHAFHLHLLKYGQILVVFSLSTKTIADSRCALENIESSLGMIGIEFQVWFS